MTNKSSKGNKMATTLDSSRYLTYIGKRDHSASMEHREVPTLSQDTVTSKSGRSAEVRTIQVERHSLGAQLGRSWVHSFMRPKRPAR